MLDITPYNGELLGIGATEEELDSLSTFEELDGFVPLASADVTELSQLFQKNPVNASAIFFQCL
jgi:hypothetical protein